MIIKRVDDVQYEDTTGYKGVKKRILIGARDGSQEAIMRCFYLEPGGATPYHKHGFPHLVKVDKGSGVVIDADGQEHPLKAGSLVYVPDNEVHGFKNTGQGSLDLICVVPERGEQ